MTDHGDDEGGLPPIPPGGFRRGDERDEDYDADFFLERRGGGNEDDEVGDAAGVNGLTSTELDEILRKVEEAPEVKEMDDHQLRVAVNRLAKATEKNAILRAKHPDDPEKFLNSELDLDEAIKALKNVATEPGLYGLFVSLGAVPLLQGLLDHENVDIGIEVIGLFSEMLEPDALNVSETTDEKDVAEAWRLVETLVMGKCLESMVKLVDRLTESESEHAQCAYNFFEMIETLVESRAEIAARICVDTSLLTSLANRVLGRHAGTGRGNSSVGSVIPLNRVFASELLALLVTTAKSVAQDMLAAMTVSAPNKDNLPANRGSSGSSDSDSNGRISFMSALIELIAPHRRGDPEDDSEEEFLSNVFGTLVAAVPRHPAIQKQFIESGGVELMIMFVRRDKHFSEYALKVIEAVLEGNSTACEKFVDAQGLKVLFAVFMVRTDPKKVTEETIAREERTLATILHLLMNLSDIRYLRVLAKFQEKDGEKVVRLIELLDESSERIDKAESTHARLFGEAKEDDETERAQAYLRKLDNGLFAMQRAACIVAFLYTSKEDTIKQKVEQQLSRRDLSIGDIKRVMLEQTELMGTGHPVDDQTKKIVEVLVNQLQD